MGSIGAGEIIVIAIVALVVFGPHRLPEIARKASELLTKARAATQTLTDAIDTEFDGVASPIKDLKSEYDETMRSIKDMASPTPYLGLNLPGGKPREDSGAKPPPVATSTNSEHQETADSSPADTTKRGIDASATSPDADVSEVGSESDEEPE